MFDRLVAHVKWVTEITFTAEHPSLYNVSKYILCNESHWSKSLSIFCLYFFTLSLDVFAKFYSFSESTCFQSIITLSVILSSRCQRIVFEIAVHSVSRDIKINETILFVHISDSRSSNSWSSLFFLFYHAPSQIISLLEMLHSGWKKKPCREASTWGES